MAKILLAEDYADIRKVLALLLAPYGHEVIEAEDGRQAVDLAREHHPDLILMDMSMPVLSGWDATRILKGEAGTADIPIIALTAHALKGDRERAWAAGCDVIITKPIDDELLEHTIAQVLSEKEGDGDQGALAGAQDGVVEKLGRANERIRSISNHHILIIDADPEDAALISNQLKANGYRTSVAEQASQALALIEDEQPDLVICEMDLPDMSGFELTERIKNSFDSAFVPVLMVTEESFDWERALEVGADDFLDKPINPSKLLVRVRSLVRLKLAVMLESNRANELASVLSQMATGLIIADADGTISVVNGRGLEIIGIGLDEVIGADIDTLAGHLLLRDAECGAIDPSEFPLKRALVEGETVNRQLICLRKRGGKDIILRFNAAPIYNEHGRKTGAVSIFDEVTEEEVARTRATA